MSGEPPVNMRALECWTPGPDTVLRSGFESRFRDAGGRIERRGGWLVVAAVDGEEAHLGAVGFADGSHLGKIEVRGGPQPLEQPDRAVIEVTSERWIVLSPWEQRAEVMDELETADRRLVLDLSSAWSLLLLAGPQAERLLRRLGPIAAVPGAGPIASIPGRVLRRGAVIWVMVPLEYAQHVWDVCADLCIPLGGGPTGIDAVARIASDPLLGAR